MSTTTKPTVKAVVKPREIVSLNEDEWTNLRVKCVQIWDNDHPSIAQVGLLGDETGIIKFVSWTKSQLPTMEEDVEYDIVGVPVSAYQGRLQVSLNSKTTITPVLPVQTELAH